MTKLVTPLLLLMWVAAHIGTVNWLVAEAQERPQAWVLFALVAAATVYAFHKFRLDDVPARPRMPIILLGLVAVLSLVNLATIHFEQFQVSFFLMGCYAWLGLHGAIQQRWEASLSVAAMVALAVPFYLEFNSGFGFGLRLGSAHVVSSALQTLGFSAVSSHDVIVTENAIAHIDLPCSGLKSLWTGSAFYLAAMIVLGVRLSLTTALKYFGFVALLLSANTLRILILTLLTTIYDLPVVAEMLHVPLGVFGFVLSCLAAWLWLRGEPVRGAHRPAPVRLRFAPWAIGIVAVMVGAGMLTLRQDNHAPAFMPTVSFSSNVVTQEIPLSAQEVAYFSNRDETHASKWRLDSGEVQGSMLLVQSRDFNVFHAPELCMAAAGVSVDEMQTIILEQGQVRLMSLNDGQATGLYWLQSEGRFTDDFADRFWQYIVQQKVDWTLVSIVIDQPYPGESSSIESFVQELSNHLN